MFNKLLPWVISILLAVVLVVQFVQLRQLQTSLDTSNQLISEKMSLFDDKLGRAKTLLDNSGELIKYLRIDIPDDIQRDLSQVMAEIKTIGKARLSHETSGGGKVLRSQDAARGERFNRRAPHEEPDVHVAGGGTVSLGKKTVDPSPTWKFSDWRLHAELSVDDIFSYRLNQSFDVLLVEASRGEGSSTYLRIWELDSEGVRIEPPLQVEDFKVVRRSRAQSKFHLFNPKLEIALVGKTSLSNPSLHFAPDLGISLMSYGSTVDDLTWRFLRVGVNYTGDNIGVSLSPVSYNLGKNLPLVSNVWISPMYIWSSNHNIGLAIGGTL